MVIIIYYQKYPLDVIITPQWGCTLINWNSPMSTPKNDGNKVVLLMFW